MLDWIVEFWRGTILGYTCNQGRFIFVGLSKQGPRVLLIEDDDGLWHLPGGRFKKGSTAKAGARDGALDMIGTIPDTQTLFDTRVTYKEPKKALINKGEKVECRVRYFVCLASGKPEINLSRRFKRWSWVPISKIGKYKTRDRDVLLRIAQEKLSSVGAIRNMVPV